MPKISVIVPVYNVEEYLKSMLDSILVQDFMDCEFLLIDDGSTDKSGVVCDELEAGDSRIKVFHIPNGGVSHARNFGLSKASGEYIHFADADDFVEPGMYARFAEIVKAYRPDIVMCGSLQINLGRNTSTVVAPSTEAYLNGRNQIAGYLNQIPTNDMKCLIHYVWNKWYRRDFLLNHQLAFSPELNLGEDYVFNCTVVKTTEKIYMVADTFYHYFIRGKSLVSAFQPEPWKNRQTLFDAHKNVYEFYGIWETNEKSIVMEEGKMCFAALRSVNSKRCKLTSTEKADFLKKFFKSKQMEMALFYLENSGKKLHKMWLFLIHTFGISGIRIMLLADYMERVVRGK